MKITGNKTLLWLSKVSGRKKILILALLLVQAVLGFISVAYALVIREAVDKAADGDGSGFWKFVFGFVGIVALQISLQAVFRFLQEYTRSGLENGFKARFYDALLCKKFGKVCDVHSGEWMNRLTSDTVIVADGMTTIIPNVAGLAIRLFGAFIAIMVIEPRVGYVIIPGGLILLFGSTVFRKKLKNMHKNVQEADGKVRMFLQEHLSSLIVVKSFVQEADVYDQSIDKMEEHRKQRLRKSNFSNVCNICFSLMINGVYAFGVIYGGYGILKGNISYGTFFALIQLVSQMQMPFANISGYLPKFYAMLASAERLMEVEDFEDDYFDKVPLSVEQIKSFYQNEFVSLGLKDAKFSYNENAEWAVDTDSLQLKKGEFVAISGQSGCGKSTIMKILMNLYSLNEGQCFINDNILDSRYRRLFAYVPQGNMLMSGTIRDVVTFAKCEKSVDDEAIIEALKIACADDFVLELPNGIDTVLGENGAGLSEGQMQRIAIARAIFSESPILLLDEATSALDEENEKKLLENIRSLTNKTVLMVTHRTAVFEVCDRIISI